MVTMISLLLGVIIITSVSYIMINGNRIQKNQDTIPKDGVWLEVASIVLLTSLIIFGLYASYNP
jgi:hypothetical protein